VPGTPGFFPLDANVRFNERGALHSVKTPGELFARFTPAPKEELDEDVARRAFALVQQLDSGATNKAPTTLTVFRLYCMEELSAAQIARKYRCSKATIISRLNCIRAKTGVDPANLRRLSAHLGKMEADLTDSRAERIHRKNLIYDKEQES